LTNSIGSFSQTPYRLLWSEAYQYINKLLQYAP